MGKKCRPRAARPAGVLADNFFSLFIQKNRTLVCDGVAILSLVGRLFAKAEKEVII
jgi:hypothetical protein